MNLKFIIVTVFLLFIILCSSTFAEIVVVDLEITIIPPFSPQLTFLDQANKQVTITGNWTINNTGLGDITVTVNTFCPGLTCTVYGFTSGTIPENEIRTTYLNVTLPCDTVDYILYPGVSITYDDAYGYSPPDPQTNTSNITLRVEVPKPDIQFASAWNNIHYPEQSKEHTITWNVNNNGRGKVKINNVNPYCQSEFDCFNPTFSTTPFDEGGNSNVNLQVNVSDGLIAPDVNYTNFESWSVSPASTEITIRYNLKINHTYDEGYNLACITPKEKELLIPFSIVRVCNETYHPKQVINVSGTVWYCIKSSWEWSQDPAGNNTPPTDEYCYTGTDPDLDIDCCLENNSYWDLGNFAPGTSADCCQDDSGEYFLSSSLDSTHGCCNSATDCVYNSDCYDYGSYYTVDGTDYYCAPLNGDWYLHPLVEFVSKSLYLELGRSEIADVIVRNVQLSDDVVNLTILWYPDARFVLNNNQSINVTLNPSEEKRINIRVSSSEAGIYPLEVNGVSLTTGTTDSDLLNIKVGYPAEFSGLGDLGIIIIIFLGSLIVFRIKEK